MQPQQESPKRSFDPKRGIFTSKEKDGKQSVIPYLDNSLQGLKQDLQNIKARGRNYDFPNMVGSTTVYTHINQNSSSHGLSSLSPIINRNIGEERRNITPPKVSFAYPEGTHVQYHALNSGNLGNNVNVANLGNPINFVHLQGTQNNQTHFQTVGSSAEEQRTNIQNVQNIQSIQGIHEVGQMERIQTRKTFVPIHLYNQIPVNLAVPQSKPSEQGQQSYIMENNDEAYEVLLSEYEKVFQKLQNQRKNNYQLQQLITSLRNQLSLNGRTRKFQLNLTQLHQKLYALYLPSLQQTLSHHKSRAKKRISQLITSAQRETSVVSVQGGWRMG